VVHTGDRSGWELANSDHYEWFLFAEFFVFVFVGYDLDDEDVLGGDDDRATNTLTLLDTPTIISKVNFHY
jgi:hypothetical protein